MKSLLSILSLVILTSSACEQLNSQEKGCKPTKRYLVVTPYAGLANRLRVIASAKIMADVTDRQLVVDWGLIKDESPAYWDELFLNPLTTFNSSSLVSEGCSLKLITSAKEDDPGVKNLGSLNTPKTFPGLQKIVNYQEPIVYVGTSYEFAPPESSLSKDDYNKRYRNFYKTLEPVAVVSDEAQDFQQENKFDDHFMVGVHYRSWATGTPDETQGVIVDRENRYVDNFIAEMKKALNEPSEKTNNKPVAFFLAADDAKVKDKLNAVPEFKGRIFTRNIVVERSTVRGQQLALVDWVLLGTTNYIIGTLHSSFSDEAAHLTTQNRKVNIGDNPWGL